MTILKTLVLTEEGLMGIDTIEHEGMLWLVPEWIDTPCKGWSRPARIVCLSGLDYIRAPVGSPDQYVLRSQNPMPKSVLSGQIPPQLASQYVVIDHPDIEFETHSSGRPH